MRCVWRLSGAPRTADCNQRGAGRRVTTCGAAQVRVARLKAGALARGSGGGGGWLGGAAALLEPEPQGAWCAYCQTWAAADFKRREISERQRPFLQPSVPCQLLRQQEASVGACSGELRGGRAAQGAGRDRVPGRARQRRRQPQRLPRRPGRAPACRGGRGGGRGLGGAGRRRARAGRGGRGRDCQPGAGFLGEVHNLRGLGPALTCEHTAPSMPHWRLAHVGTQRRSSLAWAAFSEALSASGA